MIEQIDTIYGRMFVPDTDNGQYWWLKTTRASPEDEMIEIVCDLLDARPRGIAIDAGANFGCWTLPLAKHAIKVLAFEPQRCVRECLLKTLEDHPDKARITVIPCALGSKTGLTRFPDIKLEDSTNFGGVAADEVHIEHPDAPMYVVPLTTIDHALRPYQGPPVSFIKADIEGGEIDLFKGAIETIKKWKPIIIAEADHPRTDRFELGNLIESLGYNVEILKDNNFICMPV